MHHFWKNAAVLALTLGVMALVSTPSQAMAQDVLRIGVPKITSKPAGPNKVSVSASTQVELLGAKATFITPPIIVTKGVNPPPQSGGVLGVSLSFRWKWSGETLTCTATAKATAVGKTHTVTKSSSLKITSS